MGVEAPPAARGQKLFAKQKGVAYFVTDRYLGERSLLTADGQSAFRLPYDGRQRERVHPNPHPPNIPPTLTPP